MLYQVGEELLICGNIEVVTDCHFIIGTAKERGLVDWANEMPLGDDNINDGTATDYDFPYGMETLRR